MHPTALASPRVQAAMVRLEASVAMTRMAFDDLQHAITETERQATGATAVEETVESAADRLRLQDLVRDVYGDSA